MTNTCVSLDRETEGEVFHVLFSTDFQNREGLFAVINSIVTNTRKPEAFFFHVLVDEWPAYYERVLATRFEDEFRYEVVAFETTEGYVRNADFLRTNMRVQGGAKRPRRIHNLMNFARFYLPEVFPAVDFGLYLDVDMIVQTDLARLFDIILTPSIVAAPLNRDLDNYHRDLEMTDKGFNAGFLLIDFDGWRRDNVTSAIEKVMRLHKEELLFDGGTQPLLNVVFYNQCFPLDDLWNTTGLGRRSDLDQEFLRDSWILHWNGSRKPWMEDGMYKEFWEKYRISLLDDP